MHWEELLGPAIPLVYLVMLAVERFRPSRAFPKVKGWAWIGALFTTIMMALNIMLPQLLPGEWLAAHRLLNLDGMSEGVQVVLGVLLISFVDYVYHRSEHAFHWMWRWSHQVHHSALRVDMSGAFYTSPVEISAAVLYSVLPLVLLGFSADSASIAGFLLAFASMFQHWNISTPRWIGYFIQRPESHCLHHEYGVHARNYSTFPPWDMLFGSFENPESFKGRVGFDEALSKKLFAMLGGRDVLTDAPRTTR